MKVSDRDNRDRIFLAASLIAVIILACLSIGALLVFSQRSMNSLFDRVERQYRQDIIHIVSVARSAVEPVLIKVRSGEIGREEAIRQIRTLVRNMTYKDEYGNNYVFMSSYDGMMLVQPFEPHKESTNQWDLQDANGFFIIRELVKAARTYPNGSFVQYYYYLPGVYDVQKKLAYVVGLPELECYIGTGMYMERAIQEQREILTDVKYASICLLIAVLSPVAVSIFVILKRNKRLLAEIRTRKKVEEDLKRGEEKYRSIFENAMEGIYQTTLDGRFISVNPAFAHMLRYDSPEEVLNTITDISHQIYVNPEHRAELLRLLIEQSAVLKFETRFFRKDGSIAWVTLNVRAVRDKTGQIIYIEGTAEDISGRKVLEARLFQMQKMEAIGTLAGGIAHDFNNMLAPIIGYCELALQEIPADTRLYRNIEQVLRSGCRAKDLIKQILTFSRKAEQERGPVQVSTIVKETHEMLRATLPSTIEIRRNIGEDAGVSTVVADPTHIHQVLMNLCTNAAHAMREKGGVLSISLDKVDIDSTPGTEIPDLQDGSYLRLTVSDTGHGMDEKQRQRIFDPYFTTKGPDEGTGLGLAVVYGIVKGLSGGITVSSEPGEGATFQVFFPITETSEAASAAVAGRLPTGSGHILIVDDEKDVVEMQKEMLERLGYEVTLSYSSADALVAFKEQSEHFDLVITDQTMPHMTGSDLAKEILMIRPDIPIILCTGFSAIVDETKARNIGIKAFLMKPVTLRQLAEEIHRLLNQE